MLSRTVLKNHWDVGPKPQQVVRPHSLLSFFLSFHVFSAPLWPELRSEALSAGFFDVCHSVEIFYMFCVTKVAWQGGYLTAYLPLIRNAASLSGGRFFKNPPRGGYWYRMRPCHGLTFVFAQCLLDASQHFAFFLNKFNRFAASLLVREIALHIHLVERKKGCQVARKFCLVAPGSCLAKQDLFSAQDCTC